MNAIKSIFPQRLVKSLLTAGMFCMGISACADDTAAPEKSFSIADIAELERFYDSYANKRIELPGSGYESGDIVQFIDTGISHNTYTMQYEQTGDGLLVTLPDNLASSEYGIYIVRGGMKFLYGKSYFGRFDSRRLTAGNHPRLLMDSSDFETLKAQLAVADPTSLLARMHTECMVVADAWGISDSEGVTCCDMLEKDIAHLADILGHSSVETTRIYLMISERQHGRMLERMKLVI